MNPVVTLLAVFLLGGVLGNKIGHDAGTRQESTRASAAKIDDWTYAITMQTQWAGFCETLPERCWCRPKDEWRWK